MNESKYRPFVIACPPYPKYVEQPKDQSLCELFDCPHCENKMWLSEKKKGILMFASCTNKDIYLGCYECVDKFLRKKIPRLKDMSVVNI